MLGAGYGLLTLDTANECVTLQDAPKVAGAPIACIGAGTGLGECFSTATTEDAPYETYPSEGGHAEWSPRTAIEVELLNFLKDKFKAEGSQNRVSIERLVSGPGLASMYEFYAQRFPEKRVAAVHQAVLKAGEMKGRVIAEHSLRSAKPFCSLCEMTVRAKMSGPDVAGGAWIGSSRLFRLFAWSIASALCLSVRSALAADANICNGVRLGGGRCRTQVDPAGWPLHLGWPRAEEPAPAQGRGLALHESFP